MALRDMIYRSGRKTDRKNEQRKDLQIERRRDPYQIMRDVIGPMEAFFERPWGLLSESRTARFEVEELPDEILVTAKLPGMARDDLNVEVTENTLTLRGAKSSSQGQRRHGGLERKESMETFVRSFTLPTPIKPADVTASFKDGSLEIHLPRVTQTPVRNVDIT